MKKRLLKKETVLDMCAVSNSTLYRMIKKRTFPAPVLLAGSRAVAWHESEVLDWIENRPRAL